MDIREISEQVERRLKNEMIVYRYNAYSTNSVYFNFDYGVACSLRISDHTGKRHLAYRYNIGLDVEHPYETRQGNLVRKFWPANMTEDAIEDILDERRQRMARYHNYEQLVSRAREKAKVSPGFWRQAREAT